MGKPANKKSETAKKSEPGRKPEAKRPARGLAIDPSLLDAAVDQAVDHLEKSPEPLAQAAVAHPMEMDLRTITWRADPTRKVSLSHAVDLAESIAVHGLIEPIAVDRKGTLLAGGHRFFASLLLITPQAQRQELIEGLKVQLAPEETNRELALALQDRLLALPHQPGLVRVNQMDLDAEQEPDRALAIEISENEKRRDYTKAEIRALADTLAQRGYSFKRGRRASGGPAMSGQKMLELIVGKSYATIYRVLEGDATPSATKAPSAARSFRAETVYQWIDGQSDQTVLGGLIERAQARLQHLAAHGA